MTTDITVPNPVLAEHARAIHELAKRTCEDIIDIGRHLAEARECVAHGAWLDWVDAEFGWSDQTARRFIQVYELSLDAKFNTLVEFELPLSALYQLAAPKTPEEARTEVAARIEAGEKPSCAMVAEVIAKAKGNDHLTAGEEVFQETVKTAIAGTRQKKVASTADKTTTTNTDAGKSAEERRAYYAEADTDPDQSVAAEIERDRKECVALYDKVVEAEAAVKEYEEAKTAPTPAKSKTKKPSLLEAWESATSEERQRLLDQLGVGGVLEAASDKFKSDLQLRAKQPTNPNAWLVEKDAAAIARKIVDVVGLTKADTVRTSLLKSGSAKTPGWEVRR